MSRPDIVFLIGAPRSGTTMLGRALAQVPGCVYLEEPVGLWLRALKHANSDLSLGFGDATRVREELYARGSGSNMIVEKSPTNILRLRHLYEIFPEARFIFLIREPLATSRSVVNKWRKGEDRNYERLEDRNVWRKDFLARLRKARELGLTGIFRQRARAIDALRGQFGGKRHELGLRVPGFEEWGKRLSDCDYALLSWVHAHVVMFTDYFEIAASRKLAITYESILDDPVDAEHKLTAFCGASVSLGVSRVATPRSADELFSSGLVRIAQSLHATLLADACNMRIPQSLDTAP